VSLFSDRQHVDVLVIEDEIDLNEMIVRFLRDEKLTTHACYNGQEALRYLKKHSADIVLCDISMPALSGLELIEKTRALNLDQAYIMLTAHSEQSKIIRALQLGAVDYILKPFEPNELMAKIVVYRELGQRLRQLREKIESKTEISHDQRMIELLRIRAQAVVQK